MNNQPIHITLEEWEQIEAFLNGSLTAEADQAFRLQLEKDTVLTAKVEQVRLSLLTVEEAGLRADMEVFHTRLQQQPVIAIQPGQKNSIKKWLAIAAMLGGVCIVALLLLQQPTKSSTLFSTFYKPDPGLITTMAQSDNYDFEKAMVNYKTGKYTEAIKGWEALSKNTAGNDTLNYFLGCAYLANENTEKANLFFSKVLANPESVFLKDAYWYKGLVLLKEKKWKEAADNIKLSDKSEKDKLLEKIVQQ